MVAEIAGPRSRCRSCWPSPRAGIWPASPFPISSPLALSGRFRGVRGRGRPVARPRSAGICWPGLLGLVIGFALFALGWIGGGDAKLFAARGAVAGVQGPAALCAGGQRVRRRADPWPSLLLRQCPLPALLARQGWIVRLHDARSGIPYGVALAAGAFFLLPSTEIFRLAAAA